MSPYLRNVAQQGDALELLRCLQDSEPGLRLAWFDPQHRSTLDRLKFGNEGARQRERCALPQMTDELIDECLHEFTRVLRPGGYSVCGPTPIASLRATTSEFVRC